MIATSSRAQPAQWRPQHNVEQHRSSGKVEGPSGTHQNSTKHSTDRQQNAYQHDEVLAGFLASLHRKPRRVCELPSPKKEVPIEPLPPQSEPTDSEDSTQSEPNRNTNSKSNISLTTSKPRKLLEISTDDDAVAISCLQDLSRAIPKLEREKPEPSMSSSPSNRRTRVPMACTRCKMAHTRCDTKRPCGRCVRRGVSDSCVDAIPKRRGRKRSEDMEMGSGRSSRPRLLESKMSSRKHESYAHSPNSDYGSVSWSHENSPAEDDYPYNQKY